MNTLTKHAARGLALAALAALTSLVACGGDDDGGGDDPGADASLADADLSDAPPAACGIEEPGTRCKDARTLERCNGTAIEEIPCGDQLCGPDPAAAGGAACVAAGAACGVIDFFGACEGGTLAWCDEGALVVGDCAAQFGVCSYISASVGFNCTTTCEFMDVTAEGTCTAGGLRRCQFADGAYTIVTDMCPPGTTCDSSLPETGQPGCAPAGACASVGPGGRCSGNTLTSCNGGAPVTTDCAATGGVCTWAGTGYACGPAGALGARQVSGTITYDDRPPQPDGSLGEVTPIAARGVAVAVVDDTSGAVLAAGVSADDGSYALAYDAADGTMVHVLAATTSTVPTRPIRVLRPDGLVHGFGGQGFAATATATADVRVSNASGVAPAFNIFDQAVISSDAIGTIFGDATPTPLFLVWVRGGTDGTYYTQNAIFLLGAVSDDDGYDDTVILHECGHYIEDTQGRSDSPGGPHNGDPVDPRLAWSEGFATYWAMALRGEPIYMDSNASGGWAQNADTEVTPAPAPGGNMMQNVGEAMITEILWDVGDAADGVTADDDGHAGTHTAVLKVEHDYLPSGLFADRGRVGVELVDWLDGWFLHNGLGSCGPLRTIVTTTHAFPYDFAPSAGSCP